MKNRVENPRVTETIILNGLSRESSYKANTVAFSKCISFIHSRLNHFQARPHMRFGNVDMSAAIVAANESKPISLSDLELEFNELVLQWKKETSFLSSLSDKFTHPAYQRIMAMGEIALPWILKNLKATPGHWFYALRFIVGKDIAADAGAKTFSEAREAWLQWGYKRDNTYKRARLFVGSRIF